MIGLTQKIIIIVFSLKKGVEYSSKDKTKLVAKKFRTTFLKTFLNCILILTFKGYFNFKIISEKYLEYPI
jgi:hypothetical protein